MTKRPVKKAKKAVKKPAKKRMTVKRIDDVVENVVDQLEVGMISAEVKAGATVKRKRR